MFPSVTVVQQEDVKTEMRKKSLLILIHHHLLGQGSVSDFYFLRQTWPTRLSLCDLCDLCVCVCVSSYMDTAAALDHETNGGLRKFEVCDNIDLEMVLMEYESYQYVKFQKYPKIIRRTDESSCPGRVEVEMWRWRWRWRRRCGTSGSVSGRWFSAVRLFLLIYS